MLQYATQVLYEAIKVIKYYLQESYNITQGVNDATILLQCATRVLHDAT